MSHFRAPQTWMLPEAGGGNVPGKGMLSDDAQLLRECLTWAADRGDELDDNQQHWCGAFQDMLDRWRPLTPGQRSYVKGIHERLELSDPTYRNDFSAGRVPLGKSLATPVPEVLLRPLPKRPPGRI